MKPTKSNNIETTDIIRNLSLSEWKNYWNFTKTK